jgi:HEAT repeat protein
MKKSEPKLSFTQTLTRLFESEPLSIAWLFRLSDLTPSELAEFAQRWPGAADDRRRVLVQHMADISEENFEVDFSPVLAICLSDPLPQVRCLALDGLWDTTNAALVTPIIDLMNHDTDGAVQASAARSLAHYVLMGAWGQIARPVVERIVTALLDTYHNPQRPAGVRRAALESLGAADHPDVPELIAAAYAIDDVDWQMSALFAMGSSADARWLEIVLAEMGGPYAETRAIAARAAGEIGRADSLSPLFELAYDEDADVQIAAIKAIGQIGGERAETLLGRLAEDESLEPLYDIIDETLEEMDWEQGEFDLFDVDLGEDES